MKNVSEFTKTQALIDEYNKLKNIVPKLETQMKQNEKRAGAKIEKFKSDMQENQEDVEYKLDRAAVEAEYGKRIEQEEKHLEEENGKIKEKINKVKEDKKFFCTDKNFKTITMEIEAMKREVEEGKLEIKRKEYEIKGNELKEQEFSAEPDKENSLTWLELRKENEKKEQEIGKINKEINAMNKKIEEYSKFKGELNQQLSTFTAIDFNKMREREETRNNQGKQEVKEKQEKQEVKEKQEKQEVEGKQEKQEVEGKQEKQEVEGKEEKQEAEEKQEKQGVEEGQEIEEEQEKQNQIYSNSFIHINAAKGKAESYLPGNDRVVEIENLDEIVKNRKSQFKRIGVNDILEDLGVDTKFKKFITRRKLNPIILKAIEKEEKLLEKYIESVVEERKYPFKYEIDLENSCLDNKTTNFLNRIALKENKIEGNEVKGTEKFHTLKSFFRRISDKAHNRFAKKEELKRLETGKDELDKTKKSKDKFKKQYMVDIDKKIEEQNIKNQQAYAELTNEQKSELSNMSIGDIQNLGYDYNTAVGLLEMGRENSKEENEPQKVEKVENGDNEVEK